MEDKLTKVAGDSITRYYNTLATLGYKSYDEVERMVVLLFLEEMMNSDFHYFITESDLKDITKALYCLFGSTCLIDYPEFDFYDSLIHKINTSYTPRITEWEDIRICEGRLIRRKE